MTPPSKITANFNDLANSSSGNLNCGVSNYIDLCDQSESGAIEKYGSYEHKISSACEKIIEELPKGYRVEIFVKNEWGKI